MSFYDSIKRPYFTIGYALFFGGTALGLWSVNERSNMYENQDSILTSEQRKENDKEYYGGLTSILAGTMLLIKDLKKKSDEIENSQSPEKPQ